MEDLQSFCCPPEEAKDDKDVPGIEGNNTQ